MSNVVSALNGASASGFAEVREMGLQGMITLRGDLDSAELRKAVEGVSGCAMPAPRRVSTQGENAVAWMSPDELLLLVPYAEVDAKVAEISQTMGTAHHMAVNVSNARALFALNGEDGLVREALAKLMPVDLAPAAFTIGQFRRTRMAQVPAAFWLAAEGQARIICFRSVAQYAFDLLKGATAPGSELHYLAK